MTWKLSYSSQCALREWPPWRRATKLETEEGPVDLHQSLILDRLDCGKDGEKACVRSTVDMRGRPKLGEDVEAS